MSTDYYRIGKIIGYKNDIPALNQMINQIIDDNSVEDQSFKNHSEDLKKEINDLKLLFEDYISKQEEISAKCDEVVKDSIRRKGNPLLGIINDSGHVLFNNIYISIAYLIAGISSMVIGTVAIQRFVTIPVLNIQSQLSWVASFALFILSASIFLVSLNLIIESIPKKVISGIGIVTVNSFIACSFVGNIQPNIVAPFIMVICALGLLILKVAIDSIQVSMSERKLKKDINNIRRMVNQTLSNIQDLESDLRDNIKTLKELKGEKVNQVKDLREGFNLGKTTIYDVSNKS